MISGDKMKKVGIIIIISLLLLGFKNKSENKINYVIYYDSKQNMQYDLKYHLQKVYADLVMGVKATYYEQLILDNIKLFAYPNCTITYDQTLIVIQGDGKGVKLEGELMGYSVCMPKVKPKSVIKEWLS